MREYLGKIVTVKIERPLGTKHPKFGWKYPVNYGFVTETKMADGEELDAYVLGVAEPIEEFTGRCIAIIHRADDDDKLVLVPENFNPTDKQIHESVDFQEKYFKSEVIR